MTEFRYPQARRLDLTEDVLGYQVSDPYRWLEDLGDLGDFGDEAGGERADWLAAQEDLFAAQRAALPGREKFAGQVLDLLNIGYVGTPAWRGDRSFFTRRDPGQEHGVLCAEVDGRVEVLVDPSAIDPSGLTTLDDWQPDKEGRLLAYQLSEGGDEESVLRVLDVSTGELVDGPIDRCRYSNVAWLPGGQAFYYTRRLPPEALPAGESQYHRRVYLHRLGTPADSDVLIFGTGRDKTDYYSVAVSRDGRWLVISASRGTAPRNDVWLADLSDGDIASPRLRVVQEGLDAWTGVRIGRDGRLYLFTDSEAPRGRIAVTDPATAGDHATWRDLIGQDPEAVLRGYAILDGPELARPVLLANWNRHALSEITVHDLKTGEAVGKVSLPGLGTVGGISERPEGGHEAWFVYTDYTTPSVVLRFDARDATVSTWATAPGLAQVPAVTSRQVTYPSKDGTLVRMLVLSGSSGLDGPRPTILYGYGGFDISLTPAYSANILAWVSAGGVYAVANLRGGSEEGEEWHRAGMLDRKQNVFDDFHAAAEYLISEGYTEPSRLAVWGGSNGGLLTGAAVTQRPDLFTAAVCSAPLLDMVRYERFPIGETWNVEYGSAAKPEQLGWLLGYSPYHRVRDGADYPAVLFTLFSNDTRVSPVHGYKMCAALQHATASPRPVLLRAEGQVGHGARAVSLSATLAGDCLGFVAEQTGLSGS